MKTHLFEEHPFLTCSGYLTNPIHKFSYLAPKMQPHFLNSLDYKEEDKNKKGGGRVSADFCCLGVQSPRLRSNKLTQNRTNTSVHSYLLYEYILLVGPITLLRIYDSAVYTFSLTLFPEFAFLRLFHYPFFVVSPICSLFHYFPQSYEQGRPKGSAQRWKSIRFTVNKRSIGTIRVLAPNLCAVYTTALVANRWSAGVLQMRSPFGVNWQCMTNGQTEGRKDRRTDRWTDGWMDR